MTDIDIRDAAPGDFGIICGLNQAAVQHTSDMDPARLATLHELACYHRVCCVDDRIAGFLLAMRDGAAYENANFNWFSKKFIHFVYIDRIVVGSEFRGMNLGSLLYEDLFRYARSNGIGRVTCEYNIVPPNEPSRRFHDKFGFQEQGTQWLEEGAKRVSMQAVELTLPEA